MPEVKSSTEIAADITMAMLEHTPLPQRVLDDSYKVMAERIAEVFKIIWKAVYKPTE